MREIFLCIFCIFFYAQLCGAKYEALINNSPFCRHKNPSLRSSSASNESKNFELHGVWAFGDEFLFSIHDKSSNKNFWIPLNGEREAMSVKNFYPEDNTIEVLLPSGDSCLLKLKAAASASINVKTANQSTSRVRDKQEINGKTKERFLNFMDGKE